MVGDGETAPEFTLQGTDGDEIRQYTLSEYTARGCVIVAFYMNDFSPVCAEQICDLDDVDLFQFQDHVTMFGISPDYVYSHRAYIAQKGLSFPLLSDPEYRVAKAYGVYDETTPDTEPNIRRAVFLLDGDRTVRYRWVAEDNWDAWDHETTAALKDTLDQVQG